MAGIDQSMCGNILNATTPTGAAGAPGAFTVLVATAMKLRINSTASSNTTAGTDVGTQTSGYTAGGWTALGVSTGSVSGGAVGVPFTTQSFVASGAPTVVVSFDLTSTAGVRAWFGNFTGQPVNVAAGNSFQVTGGSGAAAGIQISLA